MFRVTVFGGESKVEYEARLDDHHHRSERPFAQWWNDPVTKDEGGTLFARRDYVLTLANREGGAHVDPTLNAAWVALTRQNALGFQTNISGLIIGAPSGVGDPMGSPAPASVRQIAYEVDQTLRSQLAHLL